MKNLLIVTGSILMVCLMITSAYSSRKPEAASEKKAEIQEMSVQEVSRDTVSEPEPEKKYLLSEYEKKIAVFETGKEKPIYVSEVYVSTLPPADRELLKKGISAEDEKSLKRLIQDYCS